MTAAVKSPPRNGGLAGELKDRIAGKLLLWWKLLCLVAYVYAQMYGSISFDIPYAGLVVT